ncbi:MAG: hypothetical protein MJH11_01845 [Lentisphaeria bacterium]|nr:hypothetical protein [Lentisphaeria bacterium]
MEMFGLLLFIFGMILCILCWVRLIQLAFNESLEWGLGFVFVPFVSLIFIVKFWPVTKKPFLCSLAAYVSMLLAKSVSNL